MEKRKLGEQWVEEINGEMHMLKAVSESTQACMFGHCFDGDSEECTHNGLCYMSEGVIIKDLGALNNDGCLPSPWGGYPKIIRVGREDFCTYKIRFYLKHGVSYGNTLIEVTGNTRQEVIDAWNRRV